MLLRYLPQAPGLGVALAALSLLVAAPVAAQPQDLVAQARLAEANTAEASQNALTAAVALYAASPAVRDLAKVSDVAVLNGVKPTQLAEFIARANQGKYPVDRLVIAVGQLSSIADQDLPVEAVISRYLQGISKNMPPARIDAAVAELRTRLVEAADHIDRAYPDARHTDPEARRLAVDHGAYVIQVGVTKDLLDRSLGLVATEKQPVVELQAPLLTLGLLVSSGIDAGNSLGLVTNAWERGIRGENLELLGKTVGAFARSGQEDPRTVVDQVMRLLDSDLSSDRIIQGLDNLERATREGQLPPGVDPSADPERRRIGDRPQDVPKLPDPDGGPRISGDD